MPFDSARLRDVILPAGTHFGAAEAASLALAYFTVGLTVSVLHITDGTSPLVMLASILVVNAVTPTLAYAAVVATGGSDLSGVLSGWLVSTRFGLFAAAIAPRLWRSKLRRAVAAHVTFDPNVALAQREVEDRDARRVYVASSIWLCVPWWLGGMTGVIVGERLGDPRTLGLDAVFPAVLLAIVWPQLRDRGLRPIALAAAAAALLLVEFAPGGVPVLVGACAVLLTLRTPDDRERERC